MKQNKLILMFVSFICKQNVLDFKHRAKCVKGTNICWSVTTNLSAVKMQPNEILFLSEAAIRKCPVK